MNSRQTKKFGLKGKLGFSQGGCGILCKKHEGLAFLPTMLCRVAVLPISLLLIILSYQSSQLLNMVRYK